MLLAQLVQTSTAVAQASGRLAKIGLLADLLRQLASDEIEIAIGMLSGEPRQGRIGIGYATLWASRDLPASDTPRLSLIEIDAAFTELKAIKGAGSAGTRNERLRELLRQATRAEQDFIVRLLTGELRQGALEAILVDAVARATDIGAAARQAGGDDGRHARARRQGGTRCRRTGLDWFRRPALSAGPTDAGAAGR